MGWISVVQRGNGISKERRAGSPCLRRRCWSQPRSRTWSPAASAIGSISAWSCSPLSRRLHHRLLAARLGGLAQRAGRVRSAMTLLAHYQMFGRYNAWANARLYDAAAALDDEQYRADRGAFFKSVHGTLNHLLATDRIWMQRFTGTAGAHRLDVILFETFGELRNAREAEDRRIVDFVDGAGRCPDCRFDQISPGLDTGSIRTGPGARSGPLVQSPDPPPRPCPCDPDRPCRNRRRNSICCTSSGLRRSPAPDDASRTPRSRPGDRG